jgi:hypothetical protein
MAAELFRGSRDGLLWKRSSAVLEARHGDVREASTAANKLDRNRGGPWWESGRSKVPFESQGQHNPARGKKPCFIQPTEEWKIRGLQQC